MVRVLVFLAISLIVWLLCAPKVLAVSLSIDSLPSKVTAPEFEISVSITGAKPATNYLKALVYKEGTHNYLAKTWNGREWYGGAEGKEYIPITISGKTNTTTIKAQLLPEIENGEYLVSIRRFTASGNAADDSITEAHLFIELQKPEPTKSPSTPSPTPQPTPTPLPTNIKTIEPTIAIETVIIPTPSAPSVVLAAETETVPAKTAEPLETIQSSANYAEFTLGIFLLAGGLIIIVFGGIEIFKKAGLLL